jgi:RNA polymerase I-specific transcription initiation factor RRN7
VPTQILDLFPLQPLAPRTSLPDDIGDVAHKLKAIHKSLIVQEACPEAEAEDEKKGHIRRPGELYKRYRSIEELPEMAKPFHETAG